PDLFIVRDANGQALAYVVYSQESYRRQRNPSPRRIMSKLANAALSNAARALIKFRAAVTEPNKTSADYVMPGCRDAASVITFSKAGESEEEASLMGFCAGIVVGLSFNGQAYGICVPPGTTAQQATSVVVQYIDGQPARIHEAFNRLA